MVIIRSYNGLVALVALSCLVRDGLAFVASKTTPCFTQSSLNLSPSPESPPREDSVDKKTHPLQKKLRYWKQEHKTNENAYKSYLQQKAIDGDTKPIYKREGKIDHYKPQPVFDQVTERIQSEIWSTRERIKLTQAKLAEVQRVEEINNETEYRLANHDAEMQRLEDTMKKEHEEKMKKEQGVLKQQFELEKEHLTEEAQQVLQATKEDAEETQQLAQLEANLLSILAKERLRLFQEEAKQTQQKLLLGAQRRQQQIRDEAAAKLKEHQDQSSRRLAQKDQEIDLLGEEVDWLSQTLVQKRSDLANKETQLQSVESELQTKKSILRELMRERGSLRCMLKQSWRVVKIRIRIKKRVVKTRIKKRFGRQNGGDNRDGAGKEKVKEEVTFNGDTEGAVAKEMVLVRSR